MGLLQNEFSWSRSRASTFDDCARKYWFHYYGSWGGWERNAAPRIRETYILKQLQSRWMWVGAIVHDQVAKVLIASRLGTPIPEPTAAEESLERMRADFRGSKSGAYRERPKKAAGLIEHEYAEPVSDAQWKEAAEHMKACIGAFYKSGYLEKVAKLERGSWLPLEELSHFMLNGVKVYVKPDFAYRTEPGAAEIVDWKTGRKEDEEADPVQLACYALYALEQRWADAPSRVTVTEYRLAHGKAVVGVMDDRKLDEVRGRIRASIASMRGFLDDVRANAATESKFPVATDARTCRSCNYRKVCEDRPK